MLLHSRWSKPVILLADGQLKHKISTQYNHNIEGWY